VFAARNQGHRGTSLLTEPLVYDLATSARCGIFSAALLADYEIPECILFLTALPKGVTEGSGPGVRGEQQR
jgi:hypothetical protein